MGIELWIANLLLKKWFKPALYIVGALLVVGFLYYKVNQFETAAYDRGYTAAKVDFADAASTKLKELTEKSDALSTQTGELATALTNNQDAFSKIVSSKVGGAIKAPLLKITDGKCRPTNEVKQTWNELQDLLESQ